MPEVKSKVKDAIVSALTLLGRCELAGKLSAEQELDASEQETVDVLLYCFNAVEDELARKYITLTAKEDLRSVTGKYYYTDFSRPPVKIKCVLIDGKQAAYQMFTQYLQADSVKITVEYEYSPVKKGLDGVSDFGADVGERLFSLGMVAEYCLINGEIESAELWEKKYREAIDYNQSLLPAGGTIPPRRWV